MKFSIRKQKLLLYTVTISLSIVLSITHFPHYDEYNFQRKVESKNQTPKPNVHRSRNYRFKHYRERYSEKFRRRPKRDPIVWCKPLSFRDRHDQEEGMTPRRTALVSFPGSGNTWVRYLLQQLSGTMTGSVYDDGDLRAHGFPGEHFSDDQVLVVKTHEWGPVIRSKYNASILLIRDPLESILSEYNRRSGGHTGHASDKYFKSGTWTNFVRDKIRVWGKMNKDWLENFHPRSLLIVSYSQLVSDLETQLWRLSSFLGLSISRSDMDCVLQHSKGAFKREKKQQNTNLENNIMKIIDLHKTEIMFLATSHYSNFTL